MAISDFNFIYRAISRHTPLPHDRALSLYNWVKETRSLGGDMAECGAYRGGSAKLICRASLHEKTLHIFDTFVGIPVEQRQDKEHGVGDFACSKEELLMFLNDCPNIRVYEGLVPQTLESVKDLTFSFVNLDMDIYVPTIAALHFFWPRMVKGGIIVMDDVDSLYGIRNAAQEFAEHYGVEVIRPVPEQAIVRK